MSHLFKPVTMFSPQLGDLEGVERSIDLNGSDEWLAKDADVAIGIADAWTIGGWVKRDGASVGVDSILDCRNSGGSNNLIWIWSSEPDLNVRIMDQNGDHLKDMEWEGVFDADVWIFFTVTWDGTDLTVYKNGADQGAPDTTTQDFARTMTAENREVWIGVVTNLLNPFFGRIYSLGIWSTDLPVNSVVALYNSGDGSSVDWSKNAGDYTESAQLEHWWRPGFDLGDIGADYGVNATKIDVMDDAQNISAGDDIVTDAP